MAQINPNYLVSGLVNKVKRNTLFPTNQSTFTDEDLAQILNDELIGTVTSKITAQSVDAFITTKIYDPTTGTRFPIPPRAAGSKLKTLVWINNEETNNGNPIHIPYISIEDLSKFGNSGYSGYYFENNEIVLYPNYPTYSSGLIKVYYFRQPNELVAREQGSIITGINTVTNTVTLNSIPVPADDSTNWNTGDLVDVVRPSGKFDTILEDVSIVSVNTYDLTLTTVVGIQLGDTIALAGRSIVAQIDVALHSYLVQLAVIKVLEAISDPRVELALKNLISLEAGIFQNISPKVLSDPPKLTTNTGIRMANSPFGRRFGRRW